MPPKQRSEIIHDRLAEVSPSQQLGLVVDVVQDPYDAAATISVARATRDDPLAGMHARGQIDTAQLSAGRIWQRHWEDAAIGSIRAINPMKEPVDGSGPPPVPFTDRQREAMDELRMAAVALGQEGDRIVRLVLVDRLQITELAIRVGRPKKYMGQRFRECLETLARLWSLISR